MESDERDHGEPTHAERDAQRPAGAHPEEGGRGGLSRRALLIGGGIIGAGVIAGGITAERSLQGLVPSLAQTPTPTPTHTPPPAPKLHTYISTGLQTPKITASKWGPTAPGYIFVDPKLTPGGTVNDFSGLIMEESGEPVWIEPTGANLTDLRVQTFEGKPVLTYWSGKSVAGHGEGAGTILDTNYRKIAEVHAGNGIQADLHEFNLTSRGTALVTAYPVAKCDISSFGGPVDGYIYNCHIQEVDIATGAVLLDWSSMDHIDMSESFRKIGDRKGHDGSSPEHAFDPIHLNAVDDDGDSLLISSRYTHAIYCIDRTDGTVRWRFGGPRSDFTIDKDAHFAWQHDVRRHPDGTISLFDNHRWTGKKGSSRGMIFVLDEAAKQATLKQEYSYDGHLGKAMGSTQVLANGNVLVGWGTDPSVTEFTPDGQAIYEADKVGTMVYRANKSVWMAQPIAAPDVGVVVDGGTMRVNASWNGATEVAAWRILAGNTSGSLRPVATAERTGFETSTSVDAAAMVAVQALDDAGSALATSAMHSV